MPSFPQLRSGRFQGSLGDSPVDVTLDRWAPNTNIPTANWQRMAKYSLAAMLAVSVLGDIPRAEAVTLDRWQPEYPDTRLDRAKRSFWVGQSVVDPTAITQPETASLDKWSPKYPDGRLDRAKRSLWIDQSTADAWLSHNPATETITCDKWEQSYPVRLDVAKRILWQGWTTVDPYAIAQPETPSLDKWSPEYPDGRLDRQRRPFWDGQFAVDPTALASAETAQIDKWYPTYPNRIDRAKRSFWTDYTVADANLGTAPGVETVTLDKWWAETQRPPRDRVRNQHLYPVFQIDPLSLTRGESVSMDKWFAETQLPPMGHRRIRTALLLPVVMSWNPETPAPPPPPTNVATLALLGVGF